MNDIIQEANNRRFKVEEEDPKRESIHISETWFAELTKHPYYSRKTLYLTLCR